MALEHMGADGMVTNNVFLGAEFAASTDGFECGSEPDKSNNIAHSAYTGLFFATRDVFGGRSKVKPGVSSRRGYVVGPDVKALCYEISDWLVHSTMLMGAHHGRGGEPFAGHK